MYILGISAFYHDSAAVLLKNNQVIAAAQEERFSRKKHDASFPTNAIKFCLKQANIRLHEVLLVSFYDKPLLKFERLLETYYQFAPKGFWSFVKAMPIWIKEKLFLKKTLRDGLKQIGTLNKNVQFLFPEHHLSHAASAYFSSNFTEAALLTIDGVGEWTTTGIFKAKGSQIEMLQSQNFPHSLGLLYSSFTYFLGFKVNSGEYKLMSIAPYANKDADETKKFISIIQSQLIRIYEDGSIHLNQKYFSFPYALKMVDDGVWKELFGLNKRSEEDSITLSHCNLAYAIQWVTEEIILKLALHAQKITGSKNLCMAGGVALNCVANGKLHKAKIFENIFVVPAAGDAGGALGAAFAAYYIFEQNAFTPDISYFDQINSSYLGPTYKNEEIELQLREFDAVYTYLNETNLIDAVSNAIVNQQVIGWFQGRMEFGPRALGNRSILADARSEEMQKKLNLKIKFRESFRPFAPSVLFEKVNDYFDFNDNSPYMLMVALVKNEIRKKLPPNYENTDIREKLATVRSSLPAITHVDFSARIQTVHEENNPLYYKLINSFYKKTNCPVIVNTSFNLRGEPIVCTPKEAYVCFMRSEMDVLAIGNYILYKDEQKNWQEKGNWQAQFELD